MRDGHGAVVRDGQQLVRGHGESVSVDTVTQGAEREVQEVQFSLRQTLPQHWGGESTKQKLSFRAENRFIEKFYDTTSRSQ